MTGWSAAGLLPGLYVFLLGAGLAALLRRWYDPVPWRALAVFGLILAVLFGNILFAGSVLLPLGSLPYFYPYRELPHADRPSIAIHGDLLLQIAPWTLEVRRALFDGRWPLWNAGAGAGMPLMGDPQTQVFQPLIALAYPFPVWPAVGITAALRVLMALVFGFLLLRRQGMEEAAALAGSLAFGLGGFLLLWLGWPMANCAALLPAVLYAIARCDDRGGARDLLLLFLATAALLLSGHPETLVYAASFAGLFLLDRVRRRETWAERRRLLLRGGLAMALAGGVAAPVLLPALDYLPKTDRAVAVAFHLSPAPVAELWRELTRPATLELWGRRIVQRLLPIAAPRAFGDHTWYWGEANVIEDGAGFAGSAALLAAVVAAIPSRGRRRFPQEKLALAALIASLALIAQPPGVDRLLGQLPVIGAAFIHQGHRLLLLIAFCVAALAACEIDRRRDSRWPVLVAAAALAALVIWGYRAHPHPEQPELLAVYRNQILALHLATLALAAGLLVVRPRDRWRAAVPWLFCGLVAAELLVVHAPGLVPAPRRLAYPVTPPLRFLQDHLGSDRVLVLGRSVMPANIPLVYGLNDVRIDNPSLPAAYATATSHLRRPPLNVLARPGHALYDLLGVRYVLARPQSALPWAPVFRHPAGWVFERPRPLPRLFLPARAVGYRGGSWADWLEGNPDFSRRALVENGSDLGKVWRASRPRKSRLEVSLPEPARVHALGRLAEPRLLASSVYQDGHWHLLADGESRPTVIANGPFVAAWLPAGEQRIDLLYRPRIFVFGCLLAALAMSAAAGWWVPAPKANVSSFPTRHSAASRTGSSPS
jgi:membrane protein YfhO